MTDDAPDERWLHALLRPGVDVRTRGDRWLDTLDYAVGPGSSRPFEGLYGVGYSTVIRRRALRRAVFGSIGGSRAMWDLDPMIAAVIEHARANDGPILDVPSGRGVVTELLHDAGYHGRLVGLDLAHRAVALAAAHATRLDVDAHYVRGTALDLPFLDSTFATAVSLNGLHVMPDHERYVAELARVLRPGGSLWLVTLVTGRGIRAGAARRAAHRLGVFTTDPPTASELLAMTERHGLEAVEQDVGANAVLLHLRRTTG